MKVTLSTIAHKTGLTKTTVSRILNGRPGYNEQTRKRVLEVAQELGFRHDPISRALAGARSMTLGLVVSALDPLVATMMQAFEAGAGVAGYRTIIVVVGHGSAQADAGALRDLLDRRVDGIVVDNYCALSGATRAMVEGQGVPLVYVRWAPPGAKRAVMVDRDPGVGALARQLAQWGHTSGALIHLKPTLPVAKLYFDAFVDAFEKAGVKLDVSGRYVVPMAPAEGPGGKAGLGRVAISADSVGQVYSMVRQMARQGTVPGLLAFPDDEWAMAGIAALRDAGLSVPEDVSVVGHDDHPLSPVFKPGLTTVCEPCAQVGAMAFEMLQKVFEDPGYAAVLHVGSRVVLRGSAGAKRERR
jgi:DNA-binding LacI/PurR family transcriptional regulator